jgi:hypothetical protein
MKYKLLVLFIFITNFIFAQTFTYSGYIYNANGFGARNVAVKLYQRTTPNLVGFTSQTNYGGHSYYRSTGTATWTTSQRTCASMNGHLVTLSNSAENNFVYSTWPSGWIGYYQDKFGAFYSEANGGWRWTETPYINGQVLWYNISNVVNDTISAPGITLTGANMWIWNSVSYTGSGTSITDIKGTANATLYNSPVYTSSGGKYLTFNGTNTYALCNDISSTFGGTSPTKSTITTLTMWVYPMGNGVILDELGINSISSGWHESVFEITGGNTLNCGFWNGSGISKVSTTITMNTWNMIGLTYDGTTLRGYLNGVNFGSINFTRQAPYNNGMPMEAYAIGLADATNMGHGGYGNFRLGDFQVYNAALSTDQMNRNYMASSFRYGIYPYSAWNGGEPNNAGGEDYIQFVGGGLWNDLPNSVSLNYVLEFDTIITYSPWTLNFTSYTDSLGRYSFSRPTNPSLEWYVQIDTPVAATPLQNIDGIAPITKIINNSFNSLDYFKYDVNNDNKITISDSYWIFMKKNGRFATWNNLPKLRLFTPSQFSTINSSTTDLRSSYPGVQTITISSPTSGGSSNYYIINTGYSNSTNITY